MTSPDTSELLMPSSSHLHSFSQSLRNDEGYQKWQGPAQLLMNFSFTRDLGFTISFCIGNHALNVVLPLVLLS